MLAWALFPVIWCSTGIFIVRAARRQSIKTLAGFIAGSVAVIELSTDVPVMISLLQVMIAVSVLAVAYRRKPPA